MTPIKEQYPRWLTWVIFGLFFVAYIIVLIIDFTRGRMSPVGLLAGLILSPVVFVPFGILTEAMEENRLYNEISLRTWKWLYWTPRVMMLAFGLFLALFSLDVFDMGLSPGAAFGALILHLIPAAAILIGLAFAWRWEIVGAIVLWMWALAYANIGDAMPLSTHLYMTILPIIIGGLFWCNWRWRPDRQTAVA